MSKSHQSRFTERLSTTNLETQRKKREEATSLCLLKLTLSWLFKYREDASLNMYPPSKNLRISRNTVPVHKVWRKTEKMPNV